MSVMGCKPQFVAAKTGGIVYRAMNVDTGRLHAVEVIDGSWVSEAMIEGGRKAVVVSQTIAERYVPNLRHVALYHSIDQNRANHDRMEVHVSSEYTSGRSLASLISELGRQAPYSALDVRIVRSYTFQLLQGLKQLHECGRSHGAISALTARIGRHGDLRLTDWWSRLPGKSIHEKGSVAAAQEDEDRIPLLVCVLRKWRHRKTGQRDPTTLPTTSQQSDAIPQSPRSDTTQTTQTTQISAINESREAPFSANDSFSEFREDTFRLGLVVLDMVVGAPRVIDQEGEQATAAAEVAESDESLSLAGKETKVAALSPFPFAMPSGKLLRRILALRKHAQKEDDQALQNINTSWEEHDNGGGGAELERAIKEALEAAIEGMLVGPGQQALRQSTVWQFIEACLLGGGGGDNSPTTTITTVAEAVVPAKQSSKSSSPTTEEEEGRCVSSEQRHHLPFSDSPHTPPPPLLSQKETEEECSATAETSRLLEHRFLASFRSPSSSNSNFSASSLLGAPPSGKRADATSKTSSSSEDPKQKQQSSSSMAGRGGRAKKKGVSSSSSMTSAAEDLTASSSFVFPAWDNMEPPFSSSSSLSSSRSSTSTFSAASLASSRSSGCNSGRSTHSEEQQPPLPPTALAAHHGGSASTDEQYPETSNTGSRSATGFKGKKMAQQALQATVGGRTLAQRRFLKHHSKGPTPGP